MENIIKKTYLGLAIQEAIEETGLTREKVKILNCLQRSFDECFSEFKASSNAFVGSMKGNYVIDNEFPIG